MLQEPTGAADGVPGTPAPGAAHTIIGLSDDPLLLEALTGAAVADAVVITCPTADRFIDQLVANAGGIALIDVSSVPLPIAGFIATVREQFPQLLLILAGSAHVQAQLGPQLGDGTIFRFVHKPASSQRLTLFLDAALRQQREERAMKRPRAGMAGPAAAAAGPAGGGRRGALTLVAISGAVLAAGAIAWAVLHQPAPPAPVEPAAPDHAAAAAVSAGHGEQASSAQAPTETDQTLAETQAREAAALEQAQRAALGARADQLNVYLQLARKRLASGALIDPADDSARSYLASAAALAPDDAEVRAASAALGEALVAQFHRAVAAGDGAEAQRWLQACSDYRLGSATLTGLSAQLKQLQAKQSQADAVLRLQREFNQRLADDVLLEPAGDSALSKYRSLKSMDAANVALPDMEHALRGAIAAAVQTRVTRGDLGGAQQWLSSARDAGLDGEELAAAGRALERARAPGSASTAQSAAAPAAAAATAASTAMAAAAATEPAWVSESALTRTHFVTPAYPDAALAKNLAGWVDLEFTVTTEGKVKDVVVLAAEPKGEFEQAARTALARCRYLPVLRDGVAVAQRARIRVRFQL